LERERREEYEARLRADLEADWARTALFVERLRLEQRNKEHIDWSEAARARERDLRRHNDFLRQCRSEIKALQRLMRALNRSVYKPKPGDWSVVSVRNRDGVFRQVRCA